MGSNRKGNEVIKICDGVSSSIELRGYIMFSDSFISEYDKVLFNKNGDKFMILDFMEIEEEFQILPILPILFRQNITRKLSCVKLDKFVPLGSLLYCSGEF